MKSIESFCREYLGGLNGILLSVYFCIVYSLTWNGTHTLVKLCIKIGAFFVIPKIMKILSSDIKYTDLDQKDERKKVFLISSIICFAVLLIWYIGYCPGYYSYDSTFQYSQAVSGQYNDWHPVLHTLLVFTIPLKLTNWMGSVVLFQIVAFSLVIGYLCETCYEFANIKYAIIAFLYIILNPNTELMLMTPWKDVLFGYSAAFLMILTIRIFHGKYLWNNKWITAMIFAIAFAICTISRHNGILFTGPLLFAMLFSTNKKDWLKISVLSIVIVFAIKGPLYGTLNVGDPGKRQGELVGLPLTVIGNAVKEAPDSLDEEVKEFAYSIATQEEWENNYVCGDFNSIKHTIANRQPIEDASILQILKITGKCLTSAPEASIDALIKLTSIVYAIDGPILATGPGVAGEIANEAAIQNPISKIAKMITLAYTALGVKTDFVLIFGYIGFTCFVMLLFILSRSDLKSAKDWKKILLCLPIFIHNFGTMLLLTGPDWRFFYVSFLICPLVILLMLSKEQK